jgi:hypothetical protein
MKAHARTLLIASIISGSHQVNAATSLNVSSTGKIEFVGTTASLPGSSSGSSDNFPTTPVVVNTTFASFQMRSPVSNTHVADLRVTVVGLTGTLDTTNNQSGLMIAQTVDSQGLTDSGTFSVLTDFATTSNGISSISLRFDWFQPSTTVPLPLSVEITSFDFDRQQFLSVANTDFATEQHGANLTYTVTSGVSRWAAQNVATTFSDPNHAIILNTDMASSMTLELGRTVIGPSLFMFEFRDPSINLIPEPSSFLLSLLGITGLLARRRRN